MVRRPVQDSALASMYWIPTVVFLLHVAEEFRSFPAWATRHFGSTSRAWYVYSHIVLITAIVVVSAQAEAAPPRSLWPLLATLGQCTLATNAVFHLVTTFLFREYSPGVVTGVTLFFPATAYLFHRTVGEQRLTGQQLTWALVLGAASGAAVIASLWLPMDFDWCLRRRPTRRDNVG
jgi:surface polysaccharide O-acyltransferase-like enzyme